MFEELRGIARAALQLEQRLQPLRGLFLQIGTALLGILVQPVGRDAFLGDVVHFSVRICTSIGVPKGPISVVCNDW